MKKKSLSVKKKSLKKTTFFLNQLFIRKIYKKFEKNIKGIEKCLVAVSGGPDSLSLAFLAKCYSINNSVNFNYALVDHKLRKDSSIEANEVKKILKKIDINCKILVWRGAKPSSNIQKIARKVRYNLLVNECHKFKGKTILLGHHLNDLHENFFLRMTRGSGLKGLTSLGKNSEFYKIKLLRPLVEVPKRDLEKLALIVFGKFIKDPSNKNYDFARIRIRKILKEFSKEGLETKKIDLTINNLKSASNALDFYVKKNLNENTTYFSNTKSYILNKNFFQNPHEVLLRSITMIFRDLSGKYYPPRGKKISRLLLSLSSKNGVKKTALGGCLIEKLHETVVIHKEKYGKVKLPQK